MNTALDELTEKLQEKIYKNYRASMKAYGKIRKGSNVGYPAHWRNQARKMCVERYNVSFAQVKEIVVKFDAIHGITHEKQPVQFHSFQSVPLDSRYHGVYPSTAVKY
jgi:trimethylamine:corrinoid methyltransferase-like protein